MRKLIISIVTVGVVWFLVDFVCQFIGVETTKAFSMVMAVELIVHELKSIEEGKRK